MNLSTINFKRKKIKDLNKSGWLQAVFGHSRHFLTKGVTTLLNSNHKFYVDGYLITVSFDTFFLFIKIHRDFTDLLL